MPNDISSLDIVLGSILGEEAPSKPDQKALTFRVDFDNYVNLCALQSLGKVSRNQLLNELLAVAIDQVASSLPDGVSDAYDEAVHHHDMHLNELLAQEGHL